jgi:hypothetical protein
MLSGLYAGSRFQMQGLTLLGGITGAAWPVPEHVPGSKRVIQSAMTPSLPFRMTCEDQQGAEL